MVDAVASAGDPQGRIDDYGELFTQVTNAWRRSERVRSFVFDPRFARAAAELLGVSGVRLYHDQALVKEPGGRPTPWHQDQRRGLPIGGGRPLRAGDATLHRGKFLPGLSGGDLARAR